MLTSHLCTSLWCFVAFSLVFARVQKRDFLRRVKTPVLEQFYRRLVRPTFHLLSRPPPYGGPGRGVATDLYQRPEKQGFRKGVAFHLEGSFDLNLRRGSVRFRSQSRAESHEVARGRTRTPKAPVEAFRGRSGGAAGRSHCKVLQSPESFRARARPQMHPCLHQGGAPL